MAVTLVTIINKHAPEKAREVSEHTDSPWYCQELEHEKRIRHSLERMYKQSNLEIDGKHFCEQRNKYITISLLMLRKTITTLRYNQSAESSKELYKICNKPLNREKILVSPAHDCAKTSAD